MYAGFWWHTYIHTHAGWTGRATLPSVGQCLPPTGSNFSFYVTEQTKPTGGTNSWTSRPMTNFKRGTSRYEYRM